MDKNKNQGQQGQQGQGQQGQGQQGQHTQHGNQNPGGQQNWNQNQNPNRDQAEGSREQHMPGTERTKGTGSMDEEIREQDELPERGSRQSER
jgi:hypothetical protein